MKNLDPLALEIIEFENGYIILEGNSLLHAHPYQRERKKWVAKDESELSQLVYQLATQGKVTQK